jgi:hypothetical protein
MPMQNDSYVHYYLKETVMKIIDQIVNYLYIYLYFPYTVLFVLSM